MDSEILLRIITIVGSTFLLVAFLVPFIKKIAIHIGAVDIPNNRKVHNTIMPRLGGLGIYFGFLLGYMLFGNQNEIMNAVLIGSFIIVLTGVIDDIKPLESNTKFMGQLIAAIIVVFYGNILLKDISAFDIYIDFGIFAYPLTIVFILGCINCMNLIDGLDGLASGISFIFFLTVGIISAIKGSYELCFVLTFIMMGSTLGFLVHNFYPAKIFMGDSGSMFLGFIISIITLLGFKNVMMSSIIIPLLILAIPVLDTLFAIVRRLLKGEKISSPDKFHIHHQLLNLHLSQKNTVLIIYLIDALFSLASIIYVLQNRELGYALYGILLVIVITFVLKTNVVFDYEKIKTNKIKKH